MEDLKKVRTMIHLAIYDKRYGEKDRRIVSHYRHGYVSKKNMSVRAGIILGFLIWECVKLLYYMMFMDSVFSTVKYKRQYDTAQKRTDEYERRFDKLCQYEDNTPERTV